MNWHIYFLPAGAVISASTGLPRGAWSTLQKELYEEAKAAARTKHWDGRERGIPELLTVRGVGGSDFHVFTTRKPDQQRIVMSKHPLDDYQQYQA